MSETEKKKQEELITKLNAQYQAKLKEWNAEKEKMEEKYEQGKFDDINYGDSMLFDDSIEYLDSIKK